MLNKDIPSSRLLIITSSAGGGLLQAAVAQEQFVLAEAPSTYIVKHDVLREWVWKWLGFFAIEAWNSAQKKGDVRSQTFFSSCHRFFDFVTWPNVFFHTLRVLKRENIDRVIDTQITSTSAIIKAIRLYNIWKKKKIILEKVMIDLPTRKATHFFRPIKLLSMRDKQHVRIRTIQPLLEVGQTAEEFWQSHCGLSDGDIQYGDVIVRKTFRSLQGKSKQCGDQGVCLHFKNEEERQLMEASFQRGTVQTKSQGDHLRFEIQNDTFVVTILLGSQPASSATLNYTKQFIQIAKTTSRKIFLFVFCAEHKVGKSSLLKTISNEVQSHETYPENLSVIPFSFQNDTVLAPLFHRSDIMLSRSGGGTAMELIAVSTGAMWIHSEAKKKASELSLQDLLKGIPHWESESALYLHQLHGAKIVTPDTFTPYAQELLQKKAD